MDWAVRIADYAIEHGRQLADRCLDPQPVFRDRDGGDADDGVGRCVARVGERAQVGGDELRADRGPQPRARDGVLRRGGVHLMSAIKVTPRASMTPREIARTVRDAFERCARFVRHDP